MVAENRLAGAYFFGTLAKVLVWQPMLLLLSLMFYSGDFELVYDYCANIVMMMTKKMFSSLYRKSRLVEILYVF